MQFGPLKKWLSIRRVARRTILAVAHKILRIVFAMLRDGFGYRNSGGRLQPARRRAQCRTQGPRPLRRGHLVRRHRRGNGHDAAPDGRPLAMKLLGSEVHRPFPAFASWWLAAPVAKGRRVAPRSGSSPDLWPKAADHGSTPPRTNGHRHPLKCRSADTQFHAVGVSDNPIM